MLRPHAEGNREYRGVIRGSPAPSSPTASASPGTDACRYIPSTAVPVFDAAGATSMVPWIKAVYDKRFGHLATKIGEVAVAGLSGVNPDARVKVTQLPR